MVTYWTSEGIGRDEERKGNKYYENNIYIYTYILLYIL